MMTPMERPRTEKQLRVWLEKQLKHAVSPGAWALLQSEEWVTTALDPGEPDGPVDCLAAAKRFSKALSVDKAAASRRVRGGTPKIQSLLTERELGHARALSESLAGQASLRKDVTDYRKTILDGGLLSSAEARRLLQSPAPYLMRLEDFKTRGIPLTDHDATMAPRRRIRKVTRFDRFSLTIKWPHGHERLPWRVRSKLGDPFLKALPVPDENFSYWVISGSVFDRLRALSEQLAGHYPWSQREASWFVLTGVAPNIQPVDIEFRGRNCNDHRHARVALYVEPWVSAESVKRIYRHVQRGIRGNRSNRPIHPRTLDLCPHVTRTSELSWRKCMGQWNREQKQDTWQYDDVRNFMRDYRRAARLVLFPGYHISFFQSNTTRLPPRV